MRVLVTGATGFVGAKLTGALQRAGHEVRAFARDPTRVRDDVEVVQGDAVSGAGLDEAMDGVDAAYYLIHSMEAAAGSGFATLERASVENFVAAGREAGVRRAVYLGGPVPAHERASAHLASRLYVEETLLGGFPAAARRPRGRVAGSAASLLRPRRRACAARVGVHRAARGPLAASVPAPCQRWSPASTSRRRPRRCGRS